MPLGAECLPAIACHCNGPVDGRRRSKMDAAAVVIVAPRGPWLYSEQGPDEVALAGRLPGRAPSGRRTRPAGTLPGMEGCGLSAVATDYETVIGLEVHVAAADRQQDVLRLHRATTPAPRRTPTSARSAWACPACCR